MINCKMSVSWDKHEDDKSGKNLPYKHILGPI